MSHIICPVCSKNLIKEGKSYRCDSSHCFDEAKEGYVNLLTGKHKAGELMGDNKNMAQSRKSFLEKGYFSILSREITNIIREHKKENPAVCDICCGEGWYSNEVLKRINCEMYGFDLSKEMVRLAAKRKNGAKYFVANLSRIPIKDNCIDVGFHLFAPFHEKEFSRITRNDGIIATAVAGENHLFEIKEILYDKPYKNDENPPVTENLVLREKRKLIEKIHLSQKEDIEALFKMTPYYYHTSEKDRLKLSCYEALDVTVEFVIYIYSK